MYMVYRGLKARWMIYKYIFCIHFFSLLRHKVNFRQSYKCMKMPFLWQHRGKYLLSLGPKLIYDMSFIVKS